MYFTTKHRHYAILLLFIITICSGCTKYKRSMLIEGMYYPHGTVQLEGRLVGSVSDIYQITTSQPFRVSEIGVITPTTYDEPWLGHYQPFEVGRSEISQGREYYISVYQLNNTGRFEYRERSMTIEQWVEEHYIISTLIILAAGGILIAWLINNNSGRKTTRYTPRSYTPDPYSTGSNSGSYSSSYSSYAADDNSDDTSENDHKEASNISQPSSKHRCKDCRAIDQEPWLIEKGDGRCKDCDGTGHDRTAEALVGFGSLGLVDGKIDCKTCYGTGQCQYCGVKGFVWD